MCTGLGLGKQDVVVKPRKTSLIDCLKVAQTKTGEGLYGRDEVCEGHRIGL